MDNPRRRSRAGWLVASEHEWSGKYDDGPQCETVDTEKPRALHEDKRIGERIADRVPGKPGQHVPAKLAPAPASVSARSTRRPAPGRQNARAVTVAKDQNKASPAGMSVTAKGRAQPNLSRFDQERFADPEQAMRKEAEPEPPAVEGRASQSVRDGPPALRLQSISPHQNREGDEQDGPEEKGAKARTEMAPVPNAISARRSPCLRYAETQRTQTIWDRGRSALMIGAHEI